jgi:aryl-alcohol dehydrogenase
MVTAKALIVDRPGTNFVIDEVEIDDLKPSEVLVKLVATGICHTDIAAATGAIPQPFPMVFGHEGGSM